jgi:HSP20 family protein
MTNLFDDSENLNVELTTKKKEQKKESEGQLTVDVFQDEDNLYIQSTIAGVGSDSIDISVTNDMVTIKGKRSPEQSVRASEYYYQELYWGPFSRSVILPVDVDADNAKATMKNGILTIKLPKLEKSKMKKIRILE